MSFQKQSKVTEYEGGETLGKFAETNVNCCCCLKVPTGFFVYYILSCIGFVQNIISSFMMMKFSVPFALGYMVTVCGPIGLIIYLIAKQRVSIDNYEGRMYLVKACNVIIATQVIVMVMLILLFTVVLAEFAKGAN